MHMFDKENNFYGGHGIVGAQIGLGAGIAFADQYLGKDNVTICFFGDGAARQGILHETFNMAMTWKLPVIFVCENNGYAEATSVRHVTVTASYVERGAGFGIHGVSVDGSDFFAVYEAAGELIRRAREGHGPFFLECVSSRFYGHFEGDAQTYRTKAELDDVRENHDCLKIFRNRVTEVGVVLDVEFGAVDEAVEDLIESAVQSAMAAPPPGPADLLKDVYVSY